MPNASILILGRYRHTVEEFTASLEPGENRDGLRAMTVHGSKGLEADYVILAGVVSGRYGFPTEVMDDPLIGLFLANEDSFPNAEERRLLYVALTRAKSEAWLCVPLSTPSAFIEELRSEEFKSLVTMEDTGENKLGTCPKCFGPMVKRRNGKTGDAFLGCQRYPICHGTTPIGRQRR